MSLKIMLGILATIVVILAVSHFCDRSPTICMPLSASFVAENQPTGYMNITPEDVKTKIDAREEFTLIDVRGPGQYNAGHITGAISIPLRELEYRYNELNRLDEIIVYCQVGVSSITAAQLLVRYGFEDVKNMVGGISKWEYGLVVGDSEQLAL
jgi:rhodanese-related sulfurtransferase